MDEFCEHLRMYVTRMGKVRYLRVNKDQEYDEFISQIYFHHQGKGWFKGEKSQYNGKQGLPGKMESEKREIGKKRKAC